MKEENKKRYWLRGGMIVGGIYLIMILLFLITGRNESFGFIVYFLSPGVLIFFVGSANIKYLLQIITSAIFYFILGALIGWIYGKIKMRGEK